MHTFFSLLRIILTTQIVISLIGMSVMTGCKGECPKSDYCHFREVIEKHGMLLDKRIDKEEYGVLVSSIVPSTRKPDALKLFNNTTALIEQAVESIVTSDSLHIYTIDCPVPAKLNSVQLFMETSASMKGYALSYNSHDYNEFNAFISELNTRDSIAFKVFTIGEDVVPVPGNLSWNANFINSQFFGSSPLYDILIDLSDRLDGQTVLLFMTDALLSYSDIEIKEYRARNKREINYYEYAELRDRLIRTFKKTLFDKGFGVYVYKLSVPFDGNYYNLANNKVELHDPERPLYIFAMGDGDNLKGMDRIWSEELKTMPYDLLEFFSNDENNAFPRVLKRLGKKGEWELTEDRFNTISIKANRLSDKLEFSILLYLPNLPSDLRNIQALQANLVEQSGKVVVSEILEANLTASNPVYDLLFPDEQAINKYYHYIIKCSVAPDKLHPGDNTLHFELKRDQHGSWVDDISIDNDLDIGDVPGKTWRFNEFIRALEEASNHDAPIRIGEINIKVN